MDTSLIPGSSLTYAQDEELRYLLNIVKSDGCRWPTENSMRAAHRVVSYWAPELVITRTGELDTEILLALYEGGIEEFRHFWHIPGGYNTPADQTVSDEITFNVPTWSFKSIAPVARRIALREIGVDVRVDELLDLYWWPRRSREWHQEKGQHPYGCPLSIYLGCKPMTPVQETEKLRFFPVRDLPTPIVKPHGGFIQNHFE